ncbi:MAG: alpha/beta fold hydrolase [Pseudomonadota bacterium]
MPISHATTLTWNELSAEPMPLSAVRIAYGKEPLQFGELRVPQGPGPFPVVVVVHGGCWLNSFDYQHITRLSQAFADAGIAAWTIEYRRLGDPGGGWPGTFLDVAQGADHLRALAKKHRLDLKRVVALGHSAGGHLALWLASRDNLSKSSALFLKNPLQLAGVIPLAAISDLKTYSDGPKNSCNSVVAKLMGGEPDVVAARYADASPIQRLPLKIPVRLIHGDLDSIVPLKQSEDFVTAARSQDVQLTTVAGVGHFELVSVQSRTWRTVLAAVKELTELKKQR